jgi:hypothetical protein
MFKRAERLLMKNLVLIFFLCLFSFSKKTYGESVEKRYGKNNLVECLDSVGKFNLNKNSVHYCPENDLAKPMQNKLSFSKSNTLYLTSLRDKALPYSFIEQSFKKFDKKDFQIKLPKNTIETNSEMNIGGVNVPIRLRSHLLSSGQEKIYNSNYLNKYLLKSKLLINHNVFILPPSAPSFDLLEEIGIDWVVDHFKNGFALVDATDIDDGYRGGKLVFRPIFYEGGTDFGVYLKFIFH